MMALGWVATSVGLVPLLWLAWLAALGRKPGMAWWLMGAAFAVSFAADVAGKMIGPALPSQVYPVLQAGLFALALLPRRAVSWVMIAVLASASASIAWREAQGFDVLLRVVSWGSIAWVGWYAKDAALRASLVIAFGGGMLSWLAYVYAPGWMPWLALQGCRAAGTAWFCVSVARAR